MLDTPLVGVYGQHWRVAWCRALITGAQGDLAREVTHEGRAKFITRFQRGRGACRQCIWRGFRHPFDSVLTL